MGVDRWEAQRRGSSSGRRSVGRGGGLGFRFYIEGQEDWDRILRQLPRRTSKAVIKRGLTRALKPVQEDAQSLVPVDTGKLKESITISHKVRSRSGVAVSVRGGLEMYVGPSWPDGAHGHLIEFGTVKTKPQPFLRPAWDRNVAQMSKIAREEISKAISKAIGTLVKKAEKGTLGKSTVRHFLGR